MIKASYCVYTNVLSYYFSQNAREKHQNHTRRNYEDSCKRNNNKTRDLFSREKECCIFVYKQRIFLSRNLILNCRTSNISKQRKIIIHPRSYIDELFTMFIVLVHMALVFAYLYVEGGEREREKEAGQGVCANVAKWYLQCKTRLKARRSLIMHSTIRNNRARWCFISWYDITTCLLYDFLVDRFKVVELKLRHTRFKCLIPCFEFEKNSCNCFLKK